MQKKGEDTPERRLAETQVRLGIGYMQKGDMDIALEKLQKAIETDSSLASAHSALAYLYSRLGRLDDADKHYKKAVRLADDDSNVHNNYATFLCNQQHYAEAYKHFEKAVRNPLYKTPAAAYENAGLCAMREPNLEYAEKSFRKALSINPKQLVSLLSMAELLYRKEDYLRARAFIQRFEAIAPHAADTLWLAMQIELKLDARESAAQYADQLRKRFPNSPLVNQLPNQ